MLRPVKPAPRRVPTSVDEGEETYRGTALVERMLAGEEAAFDEFATTYFPGLFRFALSRLRGDRELTREIVQNTLCKAIAKLDSFRGEAALFSWLCACCRNEIAFHFRTASRRPQQVELSEEVLDPGSRPPAFDGPERALLRQETAGLVHLALDELPGDYGRALEWKYLEHLPVKEIARRLATTPKAAESLLTRARVAFRRGFERLTADRGLRDAAPAGFGS